jgi:hypothetical protein
VTVHVAGCAAPIAFLPTFKIAREKKKKSEGEGAAVQRTGNGSTSVSRARRARATGDAERVQRYRRVV